MRRDRRWPSLLLLVAVATAPGCRVADTPDPAAPGDARDAPRTPSSAPDDRARAVDSPRGPDLPPAMRELLRDRMVRHGDDMARLQRVTLDLQYDLIEQSSAWLAEPPTVARPLASDRELLRAGLPPRFFQLEAQMRGRAIELRGAALVRADEAIAIAYGRLAETCIRCHALYRTPGPAEAGR